jgi:hypothetical protein
LKEIVTPVACVFLAACGGGTSAPMATYTIGGTVTGLSGAGLILQNNAANHLAVSAPGAFIFSSGVSSGAAYSITVATQPSAPAHVARGTTYVISGTQFNGLSQAAAVNDELNAATNYPLVRLRKPAQVRSPSWPTASHRRRSA